MPDTQSQEEFAATWLGMDPALLTDDADAPEEAPEAETDDAAPDAPVDAADDTPAADAEADEAEGDEPADDEPTEEPAEKPEDAPKEYHFAAAKGEETVDPATLADLTLTFKAAGKDVTLALPDVVRRAQSEVGAMHKAQQLEGVVSSTKQELQQYVQAVQEVREIALRMARDPEYYQTVVAEIEQYDTPESRAERAEQALAAKTKAEQEAQERAARDRQLMEFAQSEVAPALHAIVSGNPLVSEEEILGRFYTDTASITVNGVIPPEHHARLAQYLRTDLAAFAAQRQAAYAKRAAQAEAETRKTQRERQRLKNESAQASRPVTGAAATREPGSAPAKPRTAREAERGALDTLLGGLT